MVLVCYFSGGVKGFDSIRFGPAAQSIILYVGWVLHWALGFNRGIEVLKLEGYTLHDLFSAWRPPPHSSLCIAAIS